MKEVPLTQGYIAIVDDEDYELVSRYKWRVKRDKVAGLCYAQANIPQNEKLNTVLMHRFLLGISDSKIQADHRDGDGLNNRRFNLRVCTNQQNAMNQRSFTGASRFKGVSKQDNHWKAQITINEARVYLGFFIDEIEAARAYDRAAIKNFGEFARLNFPQRDREDLLGEGRR